MERRRTVCRVTRLPRVAGRACLPAAVPAVLALVAACLAPAARAGVLAPGETSTVRPADYVEPRGLLLAEQDLAFTLTYVDPATGDTVASLPGTLIGTVLRDPGDNTLTFVYNARLDAAPPPGAPDGTAGGSALTLFGLAGRSTDASGLLGSGLDATASRSADGDGVALAGPGGYPLLVVHTDATTFDAGGAARFVAADRFITGSAAGSMEVMAQGTAEVAGTFRPTGQAAVVAVPLPPAAWTALGGAAGCGIVALVRRWMGGTR